MSSVEEGSRVRKQTTVFKPSVESFTRKPFEENQTFGSGTKLGDIEYFCQATEKVTSDEEVFIALHLLLYNGIGKQSTRKRQIKMFAGFPKGECARPLFYKFRM